MSAPRDIRLIRVPDLRAAHRAVAALVSGSEDARAVVLVPTTSAAWHLRRTLERILLVEAWQPTDADRERLGLSANATDRVSSCEILTRGEWYCRLYASAAVAPEWLDEFDREVLLRAACDAVIAAGIFPPFQLRPGLMPKILAFYDAIRRRRRSVDDFERLLIGALDATAGDDRGARRMMDQTRFLSTALHDYQSRLLELDLVDEHRAREWMLAAGVTSLHRQLVVSVADEIAEPGGLWPDDYDLLIRLEGVQRIDLIVTEDILASGFHERVLDYLPGIEECRPRELSEGRAPVLVAPPRAEERLHFLARDREEELADTIRRVVNRQGHVDTGDVGPARAQPASGAGEDRCSERIAADVDARPTRPGTSGDIAFVYQRPLPYLYLGRQLLESVGVEYQAFDELPLAAEPYAASLDLVFEFVLTEQGRASTTALLRSPHLRFEIDGRRVGVPSVSSLDQVMLDRGYVGGPGGLRDLAGTLAESGPGGAEAAAAAAAKAAALAAEELLPLSSPAAVSAHLEVLSRFLDAHEVPPPDDPELAQRLLQARAAVRSAVAGLRRAHESHLQAEGPFSDVTAAIKRWIEGHTFAPLTGSGGVRLVDAQAARFGSFDIVHLLGLVEGEWPAAPARDIFYPPSLLRDLGWPRERDRTAGARAAFVDLLRLARAETSLSAFVLEDDAIVRGSPLLEDVDHAALAVQRIEETGHLALFPHEHLGDGESGELGQTGESAAWLALRRSRSDPDSSEYHGAAGPVDRPVHSVTSIETFLDCPFRYFAGRVLRLEEEPTDEPGLDPRERGRFFHAVLQRFFEEWEAAGHRAITPETLGLARASFQRLAEEMLEDLPPADRAIERARLLGSAVAAGVGERAFRLEAEHATDVVERRLEVDLAGEYTVGAGDSKRRIGLRGIADRIDLLGDGTLRVIDYKTGVAPDTRRAVQLPIYAVCAESLLEGHRGRHWRTSEAAYIAFAERRPYVAAINNAAERDAVVAAAEQRLIGAIDAIARGKFPPRPVEWRLCSTCAWAAVCRKDYVDAE